ncbi:Carbonic anhydrase 1 [Legionella massiliensis]|uniref:carbonic anhydrase n=1 Tax=Legionella massiliensis TaxID=1034943 RepID=A0A078KX08_9GAMM|nr:carbonic anhydrase [Legionella massiliensis]CDZ77567.1 Carbonic anhydrase 1 [Legionella massiliensis]CEE13305.1 Carbonic anhydrase 1 [Legionella massiliensis]
MLIKLMSGVRKFQNEPYKMMEELFARLKKGQKPEILFITCSDSRIDPGLITQSIPGDLFVMRNVGNIVPDYSSLFTKTGEINPSETGAGIQYAAEVLKVKDIIICGHSDCGAIKGLFDPDLPNRLNLVGPWLTNAHEVLQKMEDDSKFDGDCSKKIAEAIKQNVIEQMKHLQSYPFIAEKLKSKELTLHGWYYDVGEGEIFVYDSQQNEFMRLEAVFQRDLTERINRIVKEVAMNYLAQYTNPRTAEEYKAVEQVFSKLSKDVKAIWPQISEAVTKRLWDELGGLYTNSEDSEFIKIVKRSPEVRLDKIKDFQQAIQQSPGYHQYCSELIRRNWFSTPVPIKPIVVELDSSYLLNNSL